ncbi:MAG: nicotinate phosphoribosyltransferase, partial [Cyanobacteria bacterium P01_A01_bin.70]
YKLVEIDGLPVMKESENKITYPGRKQIFRQDAGDGGISEYLGLASEKPPAGTQPLLQPVMQAGKLLAPLTSLPEIAQRTNRSVQSLPASVRAVQGATPLPVETTAALAELTAATRQGTTALAAQVYS